MITQQSMNHSSTVVGFPLLVLVLVLAQQEQPSNRIEIVWHLLLVDMLGASNTLSIHGYASCWLFYLGFLCFETILIDKSIKRTGTTTKIAIYHRIPSIVVLSRQLDSNSQLIIVIIPSTTRTTTYSTNIN